MEVIMNRSINFIGSFLLMVLVSANTQSEGLFKDRASPEIKRHMLVELYEQIEIDRTVASIERHALMPAIRDVEGWEKPEYDCIMGDVHDTLRGPIFDALLDQVPSELIADNVLFYQSDFGKRVNKVVIHGAGLSVLEPDEQNELKQNIPVLAFLKSLQGISQKTILDNMEPTLGPAILACTPEPA